MELCVTQQMADSLISFQLAKVLEESIRLSRLEFEHKSEAQMARSRRWPWEIRRLEKHLGQI